MIFNSKIAALLAASAMVAGAGCSSSTSSPVEGDDPAGSTSVTLSGILALQGSEALVVQKGLSKTFKAGTLAVSDFRLSCSTFENVPKSCGDSISADGSFSVACEGFAKIPFGCFVYNTVSYDNYPITFNINEGDDQNAVNLDSTTVTVDLVIDTDTGTATADATVDAPSAIEEVVVDNNVFGGWEGNWTLQSKTYAQVASKYTAADWTTIKYDYCRKTYWNGCGGTCSDENMATACSAANLAGLSNETAYNGVMAERMGFDPMPLYFVPKVAGSVRTLEVWPSAAALDSCTVTDGAYNWKFSDGVGGQADVAFNMATTGVGACNEGETPSQCLTRKLGTAADSMITQWFPFMGDAPARPVANAVTATCKFMVNVPHEIWNPSMATVEACQNLSACSQMGNDPMNAARSYLFSKLYVGATNDGTSDAVLLTLSDYNFNDNVVARTDNGTDFDASQLKYGYRTWEGGTQTWTEVVSPARVDLGGCLQWPDWAQCQGDGGCTTPQYPTIVPVGKMVWNYGPNAASSTDDNSWKCNMPEKRLLVANVNGYITLNGVKYLEAQPFIGTTGNEQETWSQACNVVGTNPEPVFDIVQTFPVNMTLTEVKDEAANRQNGGSPEQKQGTMMGALYELITRAAKNEGGDYEPTFWNPSTSSTVTCDQIKLGQVAFDTHVDPLFQNIHDSWMLGHLLKCVMIGVNYNAGTCSGAAPTMTCDGRVGATGQATWGAVAADVQNQYATLASFAEYETSGFPQIFMDLGTNSCLPQFQMTSLCTDGFCEPKVICSDYVAEDGGCSTAAQPSNMMAALKVEALPDNMFNFFEKSLRYDVRFDPGTSVNTVCQRSEYMTITSQSAITASPSVGTQVGMTFDSRETETNISSPELDCQGNALDTTQAGHRGFKMYTTFEKQAD